MRVGVDATRLEAAAIVRIAASYAAPVPLAETVMASWLLLEAGREVPAGPLTVVSEGKAPYASVARALVVGKRAVAPEQCVMAPAGRNLAAEPWFTVEHPGADAGPEPAGALLRSVQMAGALDRVLQLTSTYVADRRQFGQPLNRFQAVQQHLALLAAEVAVAAAAVAGAIDEPGLLSIAAAKIRCGQAAGKVAEIAHQLHGAIGFTVEHELHLFTRRLWSWRDEFGTESEWSARLGDQLIREGADAVWMALT
ncbi:MAG: acyl-CoA dehydrogenase family protein [Candidatus Acidiferrales bacterium]